MKIAIFTALRSELAVVQELFQLIEIEARSHFIHNMMEDAV
jgi:hypothetical protein